VIIVRLLVRGAAESSAVVARMRKAEAETEAEAEAEAEGRW